MKPLLNGLAGLATLAYPFLVWYSLGRFEPRAIALSLAALVFVRLFVSPSGAVGSKLLPLMLLFLLASAMLNQSQWLLAYPVIVSLSFLAWFSHSLRHPPTIIEQFARLQDPELPPQGVAYTRKVTQVWCGFFILNALLSLAIAYSDDMQLWSLYNGLIAYLLMGLLMFGEMLIRRKVKASY